MNEIKNDAIHIVVLIVWLLSGIYFGAGGITNMENANFLKNTELEQDTAKVIYNHVPFKNKAALVRALENEQISKVFPLTRTLPSYAGYILTACSFGLLGALIRLFVQMAIEDKPLRECKVFSLPILGLLTGLVVLGISLVFPAILSNAEITLKPSGLTFLCLFGGLFTTNLYPKLSNTFDNLFSVSK